MVVHEKMRVLYFSTMTVSPGSGGGNTVFNLLEPPPDGHEVFYATPKDYPLHWTPFLQLQSRTCSIETRQFQFRGAGKIDAIRKLNLLLAKSSQKYMVKRILEQILAKRIDVLLLCPQAVRDLNVSLDLLHRTRLPAVLWFMDDYFRDGSATTTLKELWNKGRRRFVISEAMQERFTAVCGGSCEVLNNAVTAPVYTPPSRVPNSRLRIVYAGALHGYYLDSLSAVLRELKGLDIELDIYSHEQLPNAFNDNEYLQYRQLKPVPAEELIQRLREYDVLLLLSSFRAEHRALAETSLASKIADYLATGRCILMFGPDYSENVRYASRYEFAEVVTSKEQLRTTALALLSDPERRQKIGKRGYDFARKRHDRSINSATLWDALTQSPDFNVSEKERHGGVCAF